MIEARRYWVDNRVRLRQVAEEIVRLDVGIGRVAEIVIRPARREKTPKQRGSLHFLLAEFALSYGISPGEAKEWFKRDYYGEDVRTIRVPAIDAHGRRRWKRLKIKTVQSTEDEDRAGYARVIDYLYLWAAEKEVVLPELRTPETHRSN